MLLKTATPKTSSVQYHVLLLDYLFTLGELIFEDQTYSLFGYLEL